MDGAEILQIKKCEIGRSKKLRILRPKSRTLPRKIKEF
jgi:hypothetical protein